MKILNGGKKDYYDYLTGIYGIDEDIVYDRSNGHVFRDAFGITDYFLPLRTHLDIERKHLKTYHYQGNKLVYDWVWRGLELHIVIEVGYMQYLFSIERYIDDSGKVVLNPKMLDKFNITEKKSRAPLAAIPVEYTGWYNEAPKIRHYDIDKKVENPIFSGTWVPSFIPPEEMYNEIYNYLISVREPQIIDNRDDVQKLESKGFDKKTSFRNPINKRKK
jgi:hypothetical protein